MCCNLKFLTIPKFPGHVCLTACVDLRVYLLQGPRKAPHNLTSTGPHHVLNPALITCIYTIHN